MIDISMQVLGFMFAWKLGSKTLGGVMFRLGGAVISVALICVTASEAADAGRKSFRGGSVVAIDYKN